MPVTRDDPRWPMLVYREMLAQLPHARLGEDLRVTPLATWLDGPFAHVVYRKHGKSGIFGLRIDTRLSVTGITWPEPEVIGQEIVMYDLWEPHEDMPHGYMLRPTEFIGEEILTKN